MQTPAIATNAMMTETRSGPLYPSLAISPVEPQFDHEGTVASGCRVTSVVDTRGLADRLGTRVRQTLSVWSDDWASGCGGRSDLSRPVTQMTSMRKAAPARLLPFPPFTRG
jgi:hypothetical protein